jgi:hypothetical protein
LNATDGTTDTISQNFNAVSGQEYSVGFWLSARSAEGNTISVTVSGMTWQGYPLGLTILGSKTFDYQMYSFSGIADNSPAAISFSVTGGSFALDDVSITAVPEPSTYFAGAAALVIMGVTSWRRRK